MMNNENLLESFEAIVSRLEPEFSKHFEVIGSAETGGYLYVGIRGKKSKAKMDIRIGRREIFLIKDGRMRRQYNAVNMVELSHLQSVLKESA
jgi:hypothetical protein